MKTVSHPRNREAKQHKQSIFFYSVRDVIPSCVRFWVRGAKSICADVTVPEQSAVITLLLSSHALHFNKTDHRQTSLRKEES